MKLIKRFLGTFAILFFLAMEAKLVLDNDLSTKITQLTTNLDIFINEIFRITKGSPLQITVKFSCILFFISLIALPIATAIVSYLRRKNNRGTIAVHFTVKFLLALLAIIFVIADYFATSDEVVCVLMLGFMYFTIGYFIVSLLQVSSVKAYIDIEHIMPSEDLPDNVTVDDIRIKDEEDFSDDEFQLGEEEEEKGQEKEEQNPLIEAISQKIKAKTFLEKLSEAEPDLLKNYSTLKNDLMRYEKMKSRMSKYYESFHLGNLQIAKIAIRGKKIKLYLALDPYAIDYATYHQKDVGDKRAYANTPSCFNIKSNLSVKKAHQLIVFTLSQIRASKRENFVEIDYTLKENQN